MSIINRSLNESEQQKDVFANLKATAVSTTDQIYQAPHALEPVTAQVCAEGISGSPTLQLQIQRFIVGAGETQIALGAALALVAVGTSGPQTYTFSGTQLQAGDQVIAAHGGANSAADQVSVAMVVKALQDIKTWNY